jgi:mono/diheme cytochrome c family protein
MRKQLTFASWVLFSGCAALFACTQKTPGETTTTSSDSVMAANMQYGGYASEVAYGEHLVTIAGCGDCHTPKKMGPHGPEDDSSLLLSGHPAQMPIAPVDRKTAETKGIASTQTLTAWVGPWGVSYAANLTSDSTGIGNWKEEQFIKAIREGKFMGLDNTRPILPPMPIASFRHMTDNELKAIFAYLKSTKPIHNVVPEAQPPVTAMK